MIGIYVNWRKGMKYGVDKNDKIKKKGRLVRYRGIWE